METAQTSLKWERVVDYARRYEVQPTKTHYELPGVNKEDHNGVPVAVPCVARGSDREAGFYSRPRTA